MRDTITAKVDDTDHIAFFCDECGSMCDVVSVTTKRVLVDSRPPQQYDDFTYIYMKCPTCGPRRRRKFYHTHDDCVICNYED